MKPVKQTGLWIAIVIAALILLAAGGAKLAGIPMVHQSFAILGLPAWFGYFIGACEVAGAIGLLIPAVRAATALGISVIALGALYFHALHTPVGQGVPALLLLALCAYIFLKARGSSGARGTS